MKKRLVELVEAAGKVAGDVAEGVQERSEDGALAGDQAVDVKVGSRAPKERCPL